MTFLGFTDKTIIYRYCNESNIYFMLKLLGTNILSKKEDKYWKYSKYSDVLGKHIEWIIENIENSKDGNIRIRANDLIKEMGPNFVGRHYTSIFTGLRYSLFNEGIIIDVGKHIDGDDIFTMRFVNDEDRPSIDDIDNIRNKSRQKCRNKDLDPDSPQGFGYITEVLIARFLGIKTCFDMTGNFHYRDFDIYQHEDFGRIDTKGSKLFHDKGYYYWRFSIKKNRIADFFFCIGYNDIRTDVISIYTIPNENITGDLYINKNWNENEDPYYWYKQDPKPWNDLFHTLKLEDCPVLKMRS